jgi:2-isopropylmalate synthase
MSREVQIYDTTLRDGAQGEGVSFTLEDKIKVALQLDKIGVHYIEGGWPGSNPKDEAFFARITDYKLKKAKIAAFGSTRKPGVTPECDISLQAIISTKAPVATIFGKSWDFHVREALCTTLDENLKMIRESAAYLKGQGKEVVYDAEHFFDGYKNNPEYALATIKAAQEGGADIVVPCDTNGGSLPEEIRQIITTVLAYITVPVGIHVHNDGEMAVANTITAVLAGASHVHGTVNGYGERCGNANLCSIVPNLAFKLGMKTVPEESLVNLTELSRYVGELTGMRPSNNQPFVGESAFTHKGGVHVSAIQKNSRTYEHLPPELVGNKRKVLVSELSGLSNLFYKYQELSMALDNPTEESRRLLEEIKEMENRGFQFELAEGSFELLIHKAFCNYRLPFALESLRIIVEKKEDGPVSAEAVIKMRVGDQIVHTAAEGKGPVNAIDNALRKALERFYPVIKETRMTDYRMRVLDGREGTGSPVRVLVETSDGRCSWGTVGVSRNIVEASWQALVDSIAYAVLKSGQDSG